MRHITDLALSTAWEEIYPSKAQYNTVKESEIHFAISYNGKKTAVNSCKLKIGKNIVNEMGWKVRDRILIFFHPEDVKAIKLVKNDPTGYVLTQQESGKYCTLQFNYDKEKLKEPTRFKKIEHFIIKNFLILRLE